MSATIINSGPGTKNRKTKVSRMPYWKPEDEEWVFLPVDRAHNQQVLEEDEEGNSLGTIGVYESKGWRPLRIMADNAKAMAKLPSNWREVGNHGAKPIYQDAPKKPAEKPQGDGEF